MPNSEPRKLNPYQRKYMELELQKCMFENQTRPDPKPEVPFMPILNDVESDPEPFWAALDSR